MSILDDLKRQAENELREKELQEFLQQRNEKIYRDNLLPCLLKVQSYLQELAKHLQTVSWSVKAKFYFPGIGWVGELEQKNYEVAADNARAPKRVVISFICESPEEKRFTLSSKTASEEACQFLKANQMQFDGWAIQEGKRQTGGMVIQAKLRLPVSVAFDADVENDGIHVVIRNLESHLEKNILVPHKDLDDKWLDQFGRYILRKDANFGKLDISEEERARIRKLVEEERQRQEGSLGKQKDGDGEHGLLPKLRKFLNKPVW